MQNLQKNVWKSSNRTQELQELPTKDSDVVDEIIDSLLGGELAGVLPTVRLNDSLNKKAF